MSNITGTLRKLLPNNTTHFSRHQAILTFSESYWQTILHTFPELTSNNTDTPKSYWQTILHTFPEFIPSNTDIFREFLPN